MNPLITTTLARPLAGGESDLLLSCGRMILSGVAKGVLVLHPSGRIAYANEAAEVLIGKTNADLAGAELASIFQEDPASSHRASGTSRGKLLLHGGTSLPVRLDTRQVQTAGGHQCGSIVTLDDISDLLQMDEYVKQALHCDSVTGLPRGETLAGPIELARLNFHTTGRSFALLEINIDQFRRVNESLGHEAADDALREIARRLAKNVAVDDVLTRSKSTTFTLLLTNCTSQANALSRADAVLAAFKDPFRFGPYCTQITASIGVSYSRPGTLGSEGMMTEAKLAVRRCKALGGNRVVCFEDSMADWHSHAVQMESQMQSALTNEEFYVVYQPQVCCQTGRLVGVESLLRWQSPTSGLIMPNTFIPAAEASGLIVALGEWCLRTACKEMVSLQQQLGYPVRLAVNISPKQIYAAGFADFIRNTLQETGLQPDLLELEITEGVLMSHEDEALKAISSLQELGISVAMDDFGIGFSNLSYITRFKIDRLKIDRSFIMRCPEDHNSRMITTSLVFLAKSLGIEVVAEGRRKRRSRPPCLRNSGATWRRATSTRARPRRLKSLPWRQKPASLRRPSPRHRRKPQRRPSLSPQLGMPLCRRRQIRLRAQLSARSPASSRAPTQTRSRHRTPMETRAQPRQKFQTPLHSQRGTPSRTPR